MADPPTVRVLAAVIRRDDRFLLCRRPAHKRHGGLWEFPGGKIEVGETLFDAARRELREELAVDVVGAGAVRYARHDPGSPYLIEFVDVDVDGEPRPIEHEAVQWVTVREMERLELAPSDAAFVSAVLRRAVVSPRAAPDTDSSA